MQISIRSISDHLANPYKNAAVVGAELDRFKVAFQQFFNRMTEGESEEHYKNLFADFLKNAFYLPEYEINTKNRQDLAIHTGKNSSYPVGVILEVKRPENTAEMFSQEKPNAKALHEIIHYFLQERLQGNQEIKHLIITNIHECFVFDAKEFEKNFYENKKLIALYQEWQNGKLAATTSDWLYKEILKAFCEKIETINVSHCVLMDYKESVFQNNREKDHVLIDIFKFFSPTNLLKLPFGNDANELNKAFYYELLHILGLVEVIEKGILKIKRKNPKDRDEGSLLENIIQKLIESKKIYTKVASEEEVFEIAFELLITFLNRILFLKLLEALMLGYHNNDPLFAFLNIRKVSDFTLLGELFFDVFNKQPKERNARMKKKFEQLPYLNSGLFEMTDFEITYFSVSDLNTHLEIPVFVQTILKDQKGKTLSKVSKRGLEYLFEFLDAYDFGSENKGRSIRNDSKTILNAAVLGLVFEKINGYKEGSFFTPHLITKYMCGELVRNGIVAKFRNSGIERYANIQNFEHLKDRLHEISYQAEVLQEANKLINELRICDPAVGSGHFLVAMLNEIIWAKKELGILCWANGKKFRENEAQLVLENDELFFVDIETRQQIKYKKPHKNYLHTQEKPVYQQLNELLFAEKQVIIENCLFGVDINPKSVAICQLRLWIELLKNAYYTQESAYEELRTLPNLEMNIKTGNSLSNAFEWRFEFPKTLDENGNFVGFDILVGNPPYIKEYEGKEKFENLHHLDLYQGKMDMWYFFVGLAATITKKDHFFGFIAPNNWTTNAGASKLRQKVLNELTIKSLIDFGAFMVFDNASIQTMIMIFENRASDNYRFDFRKLESSTPTSEDAKDLLAKQKIENQNTNLIFLEPIVQKEALKDKFLIFVNDSTQKILDKIESKRNFEFIEKSKFSEGVKAEIAQGIVSPQDVVNKKSAEIANGIHPHHAFVSKKMVEDLENKFVVGQGIFVLSESEIEKLQVPEKEKTLLKPLYTSKELKKYALVAQNKYWIIYTHSHFKNGTCMAHYPTLKAHLDQFEAVITSDNKPYGLHRSRNEDFFKGEKILSLRKCPNEPIFTYVNEDSYVQAEYYIIQSHRINLKFLTGLLNSKLIKFYLKKMGKMQGTNFQIDKEPLLKIPIRKPTNEVFFADLIDQIIANKKQNFDTQNLENQIDRLVYQLYELNKEEVEQIEKNLESL